METNANKFAFIICYNNECFLNECKLYINKLNIPQSYSSEIIEIFGAKSMARGYNEALQKTDAKYKIYLHQDTFIINPFFLNNLLSIFQSDSRIGAVGMLGYPTLSADAVMWKGDRIGSNPMYGSVDKYYTLNDVDFSESTPQYDFASVVDGFLIATSVDLLWDEGYGGWDFYDADQSLNLLRNGYKIAVPRQRFPWTIHDDGAILNLWNYDKSRQIFMNKYRDCLGLNWTKIIGRLRR